MNFDHINSEPKLLVSDALKEVLQEEELEQVNDMFISVAVVTEPREACLTGNLVGVEFSERLKVDIKLLLKDAFTFISKVISNSRHNKTCECLIMMLGDEVVNIPGPFKIFSTKIIEIDSTNKLCILAIDLINVTP